VLAANHASYLDGLVLGAILPERFAFVAKRELAAQFPAGFLLRRLGVVFVERFDPARGAEDARRMAPLLRAGQPLVVFVEGTFDRRPGLRSFQMGAFVVASEAGAPVVPAAIRGTRSILRSNSWFPHRGRVEVTFGRPIQPDGTTWEAAVRLRDQARAAILQACGEPDLSYEPKPLFEQHRQRSDDTR
jgi:1-acyl-sn-glycerol-3-phosphate acyltransferase